MSIRRLWQQVLGLTLMVLLLAGCGETPAGPAGTPTPVPPTAEPTAPPTPACMLECEVGTEKYSIGITCESGPMTIEHLQDEKTTFQYDSSGNRTEIGLNINRKRTYENTQNAYVIVGNIVVDLVQDSADYRIVVTGGEFGDTSQICEP
ncbi:MAG: hypothetical protein KAR65_11295 [Anaerolineales bacterium]|nr:hypothetical protein [Anaerolineales bacterium]